MRSGVSMNKKFIALILTALVIVGFSTPLVSASSEAGTGSSRTVTFHDSFVNTNTTVIVPSVLNNASANSFAFTVMDESGVWGSNYTFNITIYDGNATWWNGTVDVVGIPSENTTGYINFTANTFSIVDDANITITMQWQNYTASNDDVWYGTVDIVSASVYGIRVTLTDLMITILGFGILILIIGKALSSMKEWDKTTTKK